MRQLPQDMHEKILATSQLFADNGLDAVKIEDIAKVTGVPKATLYYYFKSKEEILIFIFNEILDKTEHTTRVAMQSEGSAADRLRAAITAHLGIFKDYPAASLALQMHLGRAMRRQVIGERMNTTLLEPIQRTLEAGAEDGSLRAFKHPYQVAVAILGAVTAAGINLIVDDRTSSPESAVLDVVGFILQGISVTK